MKTKLAALAFLALSLFSCEKVDKLTQFSITDKSEITISAGAATMLPFDVNTPPVNSVAEKEMTMNNSRIDMIESVQLEE